MLAFLASALSLMFLLDFTWVGRGLELPLNGDFEKVLPDLLASLEPPLIAAENWAFCCWICFFWSIRMVATSLLLFSYFRPPFILKIALNLFCRTPSKVG